MSSTCPNCLHAAVECEHCNHRLHDLDAIQKQLEDWRNKNFGYHSHSWMENYMGMVEELGELTHARLKGMQGIRGTEKGFREDEQDAIGDILIYLLNYCNTRGFNVGKILDQTMNEVLARNWKKFPKNGRDQ